MLLNYIYTLKIMSSKTFICFVCNFETDKKYNYNRHVCSKTHKEIIKNGRFDVEKLNQTILKLKNSYDKMENQNKKL